MTPCGKPVQVAVPTQYSSKMVTVKCGSTSIYGDMNLCGICAEKVPNPPAHTYEDAGDADFQPYREDMDYD